MEAEEEEGTAAEHEAAEQEARMRIGVDGRCEDGEGGAGEAEEAKAAMEAEAAGAIGRRWRASLRGTRQKGRARIVIAFFDNINKNNMMKNCIYLSLL